MNTRVSGATLGHVETTDSAYPRLQKGPPQTQLVGTQQQPLISCLQASHPFFWGYGFSGIVPAQTTQMMRESCHGDHQDCLGMTAGQSCHRTFLPTGLAVAGGWDCWAEPQGASFPGLGCQGKRTRGGCAWSFANQPQKAQSRTSLSSAGVMEPRASFREVDTDRTLSVCVGRFQSSM